jgi:hypothetical protein
VEAPARKDQGTAVTATFSAAMDPATIHATSFTLRSGGVSVAGTVGYSGLTATFTPSVALAAGTAYTATVSTAARDLAGNPLASLVSWSFTTAAPADTTPPTVASTVPANNATGVGVGTAVTATFSEAMDPATIHATSFTLRSGAVAVAGTVGYSGLTATFTPSVALAAGAAYTATVSTAARDLAGNPLASAVAWSFNTGAAPSGVVILYERNGYLSGVLEDGTAARSIAATRNVTSRYVGIAPSGRIVYDEGTYALHAIDVDGSNRTTLASLLTGVQFRGFSTTGRVVYGYGGDLFSVRLDGTGTATLAGTSALEEMPVMAPGGRVVYLAQTDADRQLLAVNDDGTNPVTLDGTPGLKMISAISPTGRVYYHRFSEFLGSSKADVYSVDLDGANLAAVAATPYLSQWLFGIAPDGTPVITACDERLWCESTLLTLTSPAMDLQRGGVLAVTDRNQVIFSQGALGAQDLKAISTAGTGLATVAGDPAVNESFLAVHPGGRILYWTRVANQARVYSVNADGSDPVTVAGSTGSAAFLGIAPGGRVVYGIESSAGGVESIRSVQVDGTDDRRLVEPSTYGITFQGFSSSGKVVYARYGASGGDLFIVDHDGSTPVNLTGSPTAGTLTFFSSVP